VSPWSRIKNASDVKIVFTDKQPNLVNEMAPDEYGLSNVNPQVPSAWSQAHERRIDASAFPKTIRRRCSTVWRSGAGCTRDGPAEEF